MTAQELIKKIRRAGLEPRDYSGRGMYGAYCVGVDLDHIGDISQLGKVPRATFDGMGMGVIAYWPSIAWPEGKE